MLTFYEWMYEFHRKDDSPIGDLARDMVLDRNGFVKSTSYSKNKKYVYSQMPCEGCKKAFLQAWNQYEFYKKHVRRLPG